MLSMKRIYIEITNICNLRCAFCDPGRKPARIMTAEEYRHVLEEIRPLTKYIYLHVQGEPTLHPRFEEILAISDEMGMMIQLVTNGTNLRREYLSHPSVRRLSVSLQSTDYQHDFNAEACLNVLQEMISSLREQQFLEIRFWTNDLGRNARLCMDRLHEKYEFLPTARNNSWQIARNTFVSFADTFEWPSSASGEITDKGTCLGGIQQIAVLSDGTVVPCCLDKDGQIDLGNIFETPMKKILASDRYLDLVRDFRNGTVRETLCRKCTFRRRFSD